MNRSLYGADVDSQRIVMAEHGSAKTTSIANNVPALSAWLGTLASNACIAMEATGHYHQLLAALAHARGMTVFVLNPKTLKHYARAVGLRAKTDRVDALLIARYLAHEQTQLRPWQPPSAAQRTLSKLLGQRHALVQTRQALQQSLTDLPGCLRQRKALFARLQTMITTLETLIVKTIATHPSLQRLYQRLQTMTGVGPIVAAELTNVLGHLSFKRVGAFIGFTGLDPRPDESGQRVGNRRLSKHGPARLRAMLYTAAMAAAHSKLLAPTYQALRARGLTTTQALVVLARKIARIAYALSKSDQDFNPAMLSKTAC